MDLKEAFYKQKEELNQLKRDYAKLEKKHIKAIKENAADDLVQELLKKIQGLNNKIAEVTGIMNRYKALYEQKQKVIEQQEAIIYDLQNQVRDLQWQLDCLNDTRSSEGLTAAEEAKAKIAALSDEVARLTAKLEHNSTNAGISTAKTAIDQKKRIPNSREKTDLKKGGQPGHEKYEKKLLPFVDEVKTRMTSLPLLYWDDTVVFVDTSRACLRFYGDDKLALYTAHLHKDLESLIDDDILPSLSAGTVVMHDHKPSMQR